MSPLSQIRAEFNPSGSIDRTFSPLFNFIEECDRHFGHHHRHGVNPHFDIEEDEFSYYLVGELPGASAQDISIDASEHDDHNLTISGSLSQTLHPGKQLWIGPRFEGGVRKDVGGAHVPVKILSNGNGYPDQDLHENDTTEFKENKGTNAKPTKARARRVLLSERLTGDLNRTFNFRSSIAGEGIKASTENGLLFLVVPKKIVSLNENATKKIAVGSGKLHGFYIEPYGSLI